MGDGKVQTHLLCQVCVGGRQGFLQLLCKDEQKWSH